MLNIVVPMAGAGSRFSKAGYTDPKPLIPVHGVPMIRLVIENLRPKRVAHRFIFIAQAEHLERYGLRQTLLAWGGENAITIALESITEGAACTVLLASNLIANDQPLMICNCDQYVDVDIDSYLDRMRVDQLDGLVMTMTADHPKWSFVGLDDNRHVITVVEKKVISTEATVGIYNFARGIDFVTAAQNMIAKDLRVNNEFYVAPAYNEMIDTGASKVGIFNIGAEGGGMYGLGIPDDLNLFLANPLSLAAARKVLA